MAFVKYDLPIGSTELSDSLRHEESVFVVAGDCFGMDGYLRFGIGSERPVLEEGLRRVERGLSRLFPERFATPV
jgi:aspartate/methionine/tyrosine aminotransferase